MGGGTEDGGNGLGRGERGGQILFEGTVVDIVKAAHRKKKEQATQGLVRQ